MKKGIYPATFTLDEVETALFGIKGTPEREQYEHDKRTELLLTEIEQNKENLPENNTNNG